MDSLEYFVTSPLLTMVHTFVGVRTIVVGSSVRPQEIINSFFSVIVLFWWPYILCFTPIT